MWMFAVRARKRGANQIGIVIARPQKDGMRMGWEVHHTAQQP